MEAAHEGAGEPFHSAGAVIMDTETARDPSRSSYYVGGNFYRKLIADFTGWQDDARIIADAGERDAFRALIEKEARLLDQHRYEDWLKMFTPESVYWAPGVPKAAIRARRSR